jgi:electron transfer flavoprotein beta subunit
MDLPYASLINKIDIVDQKTLTIAREIEGGEQEIKKISLPCVLSIQSGINEPRYVSIMAIRRAAKLTISEYKYSELDMSQEELDKIGEQTIRGNYVIPESAERAQILEGETEEIARKFVDILRDSGRL